MTENLRQLSQADLDVLGQLMHTQKWDELLSMTKDLRAEAGDHFYLAYCEGKCFRSEGMFRQAIESYRRALMNMEEGPFFFRIKKDLAIALQQNGDLGVARDELEQVVGYYRKAVEEKSGEFDGRDPEFLELKKCWSGAINSLGLTLRMQGFELYENGRLQLKDGKRGMVDDPIQMGDKLIASAARCYLNAWQIEHENFDDRFHEYFSDFLNKNDITDKADDSDLKFKIGLQFRSQDLEYCLFLGNYLNLVIQSFGSGIDGIDVELSDIKWLLHLAQNLMPEGHYYHQKWLDIQSAAEEKGLHSL